MDKYIYSFMIKIMNNAFMKFDKWVKEGVELIDKNLPLYNFLYKLIRLMNRENNLEKILLEHLENTKNNIEKKITKGYAVANINSLIEELRNNIIMRNYFSIFYNVETLAERIVDLIIGKKKGSINEEICCKIREDMNNEGFTLQSKIKRLKEVYDDETPDTKMLIKIIQLLQRIRNKFMYHIVNYDDYQFVFSDDIGKKDEFLQRKIIQPILEEIRAVKDIIKEISFENQLTKNLLDFYQKSWTKLSEFYEREKSSNDSIILNIDIYEHLPQNFAEISYIFILFFGKHDLRL